MSFPKRVVDVLDGSTQAFGDRVLFGIQVGVANPAAAGEGDNVAVNVTFASPTLPPEYLVFVSPSQACTWFISNKSNVGFTVNLVPPNATTTLAAGTFDVMLIA